MGNPYQFVFQTRKNHRGGIKKPSTRRHMSMKGGSINISLHPLRFAPLPLHAASPSFNLANSMLLKISPYSGCDPKFLRNLKFAKKHNLNQHQKEKKAASA